VVAEPLKKKGGECHEGAVSLACLVERFEDPADLRVQLFRCLYPDMTESSRQKHRRRA